MMKGFGSLFMFLLIGTVAFMWLGCSCKGSTVSNPGMVSIGRNNAMTATTKSRMLKDNMDPPTKVGDVNLEDYSPIDPVPSSTTFIRPGPIQHGTPGMPYIPEPSPSPPPTQTEDAHGTFP